MFQLAPVQVAVVEVRDGVVDTAVELAVCAVVSEVVAVVVTAVTAVSVVSVVSVAVTVVVLPIPITSDPALRMQQRDP